jgi:tetratricopeptide (TPR) repeat protein
MGGAAPVLRHTPTVVLVTLLLAGLVTPALGGQSIGPDQLYRDRDNVESARRAAEIWTERVAAAPDDVESGWKLARASYWMGTSAPGTKDEQQKWLEGGIAAARRVIEAAPTRPEGHFWLAANMGALADGHGTREGIRYRRPIRQSLETVLKIDPGYLDGSADRALGRWYFKVPGLLGGNKTRAEEHLRKALAYKPDSVITLLFLAELLIDRNRRDEARTHLTAAIAAPVDPQWIPEDRRFKEQARALLKTLPAPAGETSPRR